MANESWYRLDSLNQAHGPYSRAEILALHKYEPEIQVAPEGATDWRFVEEWEELRPPKRRRVRLVEGRAKPATALDENGQPVTRGFRARENVAKLTDELVGVCRGMLADGDVSVGEADYLRRWCNEHGPYLSAWPIREIAARISTIYTDGIVTEKERRELGALLQQVAGHGPKPEAAVSMATRLPIDAPPPSPIVFAGRAFCATGAFVYGSRDSVEAAIKSRGGSTQTSVTNATDILLIGAIASRDWKYGSFGTKIEKAVKMREVWRRPAIIAEEHWVTFLEA